MNCRPIRNRRTRRNNDRRGAVVVEFAIVVPVLMILLLGLITVSQMCQMSIVMQNAMRQGARLSGMERKGILADGQTTNEKMTLDIQNFLNAAGYNGDGATVAITDPDTGATMDLDNPGNDFKLFESALDLPLSDSDEQGAGEQGAGNQESGEDSWSMSRTYVFRNARAPSLCD